MQAIILLFMAAAWRRCLCSGFAACTVLPTAHCWRPSSPPISPRPPCFVFPFLLFFNQLGLVDRPFGSSVQCAFELVLLFNPRSLSSPSFLFLFWGPVASFFQRLPRPVLCNSAPQHGRPRPGFRNTLSNRRLLTTDIFLVSHNSTCESRLD